MKKKIFVISLMVALFVCLFVIGTSAATIYKDASGNELFRYETFASKDEVTEYFGFANDNSVGTIKSYTGSFPKTNAEGDELTWYVTATATEGTDTVITVASGTTVGDVGTVDASGVYNFNSGYSKEKIVSANFPDNAGITKLGFGSYGSYSSPFPKAGYNLLFVYCPNTLTEFGFNFIQSMPVLVCEIDDETPVTEIPQNFAHDARNLRAINIPASVVKINGKSGGDGAPFHQNFMLEEVTFASDDTLTTMLNYCFSLCISLKEIKLPNSVTQMGGQCFQECYNLEKVWLGASLESTNGWSVFRKCPNLRVYYIPNTLTTVSEHTFTHDSGNGPTDTVFFFAGNRTQFDAFYAAAVAGKHNERVTSGYKEEYIVEWDSTKSDSYYTNLATTENHKLYVINYGICEAFYGGIHELDEAQSNACAGICANCGEISQSANPEHELAVTIEYTDLAKAGVKYTACTHENCALKTTPTEAVANAIFTFAGYSSDIATKEYICVGYIVDQTAYAEYKASLGNKTISFGFVAAAIDYVNGATQLIGADGNAIGNNVINAPANEIESFTSYNAFDFKLKGDFAEETNAGLKLGMALYTMIRETVGGEDVYTVNYVVADGENASKSVSDVEVITYTEKFSTQN